MKKRGVILAGGFGTRMNPATHSTNKHLLPVYTKDGAFPMIEYPILTLKDMGCTEILIITSKEHCGIIVEYLGDGYDRGITFIYKIQEMNDPSRPPGIASALKLCEDFTKDNPFVVILGDNFYQHNINFVKDYDWFIDQYNNGFHVESFTHMFLYETEEWERFGIAKFGNDGKIIDIIEKPKTFISNKAVTGMYIYTPDVYEVAKKLKPSKRGELEISDINSHYTKCFKSTYTQFNSFWSDMGTPESMKKTINFFEN